MNSHEAWLGMGRPCWLGSGSTSRSELERAEPIEPAQSGARLEPTTILQIYGLKCI